MVRRSFTGFSRASYEWFFNEADTENNDYIKVNDLIAILKNYGYDNERDARRMFRQADLDGDKRMSRHEFMVAMLQDEEEEDPITILRKSLTKCDRSGTGVVQKNEIKDLMRHLKEENVSEEQRNAFKDIVTQEIEKHEEDDSLEYEQILKKVVTTKVFKEVVKRQVSQT